MLIICNDIHFIHTHNLCKYAEAALLLHLISLRTLFLFAHCVLAT